MKTSEFIRGIIPLAACALLLPTAADAQTTPYTATGWVSQVLAPPSICPTPSGVLLRANVFTVRLDGTDPRLTGKRTVFTDGYLQADGSTAIYGTAYHEVGTWAGTSFTSAGGLWQLQWRGVMQTNYNIQLSQAGYGSGGTIDGLRLEETVVRTNASSGLDPTVPFFYTGTIKPPPVSTTLFSDDFTGGLQWTSLQGGGTVTMNVAGGQFATHADWAGVSGPNAWCYVVPPPGAWSIADGQTLEWRADLVTLSQNATNSALLTLGPGSVWYQFDYQCAEGPHVVLLSKHNGSSGTYFWGTNIAQLPGANVVLSMALTRDKENVIITTRVLDKNNQNTVLFERSFVDTSGVDPSLTAAQFIALTGITTRPEAGQPDWGPPILSGSGMCRGLGVIQFTDGQQPPVDAIFDNVSLRLHDAPPLSIVRAVRLSWPGPAGVNYIVQGAPTLQGPWQPVQDWTTPGLNQMTVPASDLMRFFRAVQAP